MLLHVVKSWLYLDAIKPVNSFGSGANFLKIGYFCWFRFVFYLCLLFDLKFTFVAALVPYFNVDIAGGDGH